MLHSSSRDECFNRVSWQLTLYNNAGVLVEIEVGVLMIGSLYWDNAQRTAWRNARLDMSQEFRVAVPIRYGRRSSSRSNTFTMVFSPSCKLGRAIVVKCSNRVSCANDLSRQAQLLWDAESKAIEPQHRIGGSWGWVGVIANPRHTIDPSFFDGWASRVSQEIGYGAVQHTDEDGPIINKRGLLEIEWPKLAETSKQLPLDLLLATATSPTLTQDLKQFYLPEVVAKAWKECGDDSYFQNNRKSGIETFEDGTIIKHLI